MFVQNMEGTLMELADAPETRYRYRVWFDYTRRAINEIQEGTLLAVPNFASDGDLRRYSVLEVTTILPMHYALQGSASGYPGFVVEAARSASQDWETQEDVSTEDTTKIQVLAIPTNLEIVEPLDGEPTIDLESNIGMVGAKAHILDSEYSNLVANNGIDQEYEQNLTTIGTMARDDTVEILLRIEELYRTHFAIFGFTGVGKSNLLSTIVAKVLADSTEPLKLVFFDLMSEYTGLLIDQLLNDQVQGRILTLGRNTLPEGLFKYINDLSGAPSLDEATQQLVRYTLLPKALLKTRPLVAKGLRDLVQSKRLRYFNVAQSTTVWDLFFTENTPWGKTRRGPNINKRSAIAKNVLRATMRGADYKQTVFTPDLAQRIHQGLQQALAQDKTFTEDYGPILTELKDLERSTSETFAASTTLEEIVTDLDDLGHSSLWVIQAHNPHEMRAFTKQLGEAVYENRRQTGRIDPLASFIFDEADEFIRRGEKGSYEESAEIAQTLARRGRKFGLGIGIATQRIRYLDTNIMAQPHTYFISKLPRKSDRQAVAEAFGMSEELLNQTFKFKKGQWLLMSHNATGLEAIPIPVKTPDANERIARWLEDRYS
ncbi:MAG: ATP-binding protein [Chloroflexi bacterium]|nr:ATP-binding protein [Chloroflexota bacterium]